MTQIQFLQKERLNIKEILARTHQVLEDFQATDVITLTLPSTCSFADVMIVATGRSSRQMVSIAEALRKEISPHLSHPIHIEGLEKAEWVLIDMGDVIVHLFKEDIRTFYQLEKLWDHD